MKDLKKTTNIQKKKEDLQSQLEKAQKQIKEHTEDLKRLQAEFENHIKRSDKEKKDLCEFATANLIKKLLSILEDFRKAMMQIEKQKIDDETKNGVLMIFNNLIKILKEEGLAEISAEGMADPFKHEVVMQKESEKPEGEIIQEVQKGYTLNNKVLRHSKVIVSKEKNSQKTNTDQKRSDE